MIRAQALRWSIYGLVAILFAVACGMLSHWQFERNEWRSANNALVENNYDAAPVALDDMLPPGSALDASDEWQPVTFTGTYLADEQLLVRNRPLGGTSAFEILVPFRLDDGRTIVVDRGWLPPGEGSLPDEIPPAPEGTVTVEGRLKPSEARPRSGRGAPEGQVSTIHLPTVAAAIGDDRVIQDAYVRMTAEDPSVAAPFALPAPEIDPGPHLSYAIQWILFAIMGFIFIGYMIRTEIHARREELEDDEEDDDDDDIVLERARTARKKRRDVDADEEDALLDSLSR